MPRVSVLHRPTGRTELPVRLTRSTMSTNQRPRGVGRIWTLAVLVPFLGGTQFARQDNDDTRKERTLYVWAGDQARVAPDFLAVIDFDEDSRSEEHTSELQSRENIVCRLLLEKKK